MKFRVVYLTILFLAIASMLAGQGLPSNPTSAPSSSAPSSTRPSSAPTSTAPTRPSSAPTSTAPTSVSPSSLRPSSTSPSSSEPSTSRPSSTAPSSSQPSASPSLSICPLGTYRNTHGHCLPCEPGTYSNFLDTLLTLKAYSCIRCPPGSYMPFKGSTSCTLCPEGTFNPYYGNTTVEACFSCAGGYSTKNPGSSSSKDCLKGPQLKSFDLDKRNGVLTMTFDTDVNPVTLNPQLIRMYAAKAATSAVTGIQNISFSRPFNNMALQENSTTIFFTLTKINYALLLIAGTNNGVASSSLKTFLALETKAIYDVNNTFNAGATANLAMPVTSFTPDTATGFITRFDANFNSGIFTLYFSKPVNPTSFDFSALTIQNQRVLCLPPTCSVQSGEFVQFSGLSPKVTTTASYQTIISFSIGRDNQNNIGAVLDLCTLKTNCFISATKRFVRDVSNNLFSNAGFENLYSMGTTTYITDFTNPELISWSFDYNFGQITLNFQKTVYAKYLNASSLVFRSSSVLGSGVVYRISNPEVLPSVNSPSLSVSLNYDQLNDLRDIPGILSSPSNSFLTVETGAVRDTTANLNDYLGTFSATWLNPLRVGALIPDTTPPIIKSFDIDLNSRIMTLYISELINIQSIQLNALSLQSDRSLKSTSETFTLTPVTCKVLTTKNSDTIRILFTKPAFDQLKSFNLLIAYPTSTFVVATNLFLADNALVPNRLAPTTSVSALQVNRIFPNLIRPSLLSWSMDMSYNRITMVFTEPMNPKSLVLPSLTLQSDPIVFPSTVSFSPTVSSYVFFFFENTIKIQLSFVDANLLKSTVGLCSRFEKCYLKFPETFGYDTATFANDGTVYQNKVIAQEASTPLEFIPDTVPPYVLSYTIDMNLGLLRMQFSEPIAMSSFNGGGITLYSNYTGGNEVKLTSNTFYFESTIQNVTVMISQSDYIRVKLAAPIPIARSILSVLLGVSSSTCKDIAGNKIEMFAQTSFPPFTILPPTGFTQDTTPPTILAIKMSRDASGSPRRLFLYFNDAVDPKSAVISNFFLYSTLTLRTSLGIGGVLMTTTINYVIVIDCTNANLQSSLSDNGRTGKTQASTNFFISAPNSILDVSSARNGNIRMTAATGIREGNNVLSFRINFDTGVLIIELAYPEIVSQVKYSEISFQSADGTVSKTIEKSSNSSSPSASTLVQYLELKLDERNVDGIIAAFPQVTKESLFLSVRSAAIIESRKGEDPDEMGLGNVRSIIPCLQLITTSSPPFLETFGLDLSSGLLTLGFSNPVLVGSLRIQGITLSSSRLPTATVFRLNQAVVVTAGAASSVVTISILSGNFPNDRDILFTLGNIALDPSSLFISIDSGTFQDTNIPPLFGKSIPLSNATGGELCSGTTSGCIDSFKNDLIPPNLNFWTLDMSKRVMVLHFDKSVNASLTTPSGFTILQNPSNPQGSSYKLTNSVVIFNAQTIVARRVVIQFSQTDFDGMMYLAPTLALSASNTYLSFAADVIKDISPAENGIAVQLYRFGVQVQTYISDTLPPNLLYYDLSVQDRIIDFYFDEVLQCSKTNVDLIRFQYANFLGTSTLFYGLKSVSSYVSCPVENSKHIRVNIGLDDLAVIQATIVLLKSKSATYLRIGPGTFVDSAGNGILPIFDGEAVRVTNFTGDFVRPRLLAFTISTLKIVTLTFSKPLLLSSLRIATIRFQDEVLTPNDNSPLFYNLTRSTLVTSDALFMNIQIQLGADYTTISSASTIFRNQLGTYLTATSQTITDLSGNQLLPVDPTSPLVMGPVIKAWELDMQLGYITLFFSANVNSSFSPRDLRVQNTFVNTSKTIYVTIQTNTFVIPTSDPSIFLASLNSRDLNLLKYLGLGSNEASTFLTAPYSLTRSTNKGTIIPYLNTISLPSYAALGVRQITFDTTPPICLYFDIDMNAGAISIVFNEPVDISTFIPQYVTLVSSMQGTYVALSGNKSMEIVNVTTLRLVFVPEDLVQIGTSFISGVMDYLFMEPGSVADMGRNLYPGNDFDNPIVLQNFIKDVTPPLTTAFIIDYSDLSLTLTFSKQVKLSSVKPYYFTLWANISNIEYNFTFTNYSLLLQPSLLTIKLEFGLLRRDYSMLQLSPIFRADAASLYVSLSSFTDVFGNLQTNGYKQSCRKIIANSYQVQLVSFDYNRSDSSFYHIALHYSNVIILSSVKCSDYILQSSSSNSPSEIVQLSSDVCRVISTVESENVILEVNATVFSNNLGNMDNSLWIDYTWLSTVSPLLIQTRGVSGIALKAISRENAIRVGPRLVDFFLDLTLERLDLLFSTPIVRNAHFDSSKIGIYSSVTRSTAYLSPGYQLDEFFSYSGTTDVLGKISLNKVDVNAIKFIDPQRYKVQVVNKPGFIFDTNNIGASPVYSADNIQSSRFVSYTTAPKLMNITLNMASGFMLLVFDTPISVSNVLIPNFRFQAISSSFNVSYKLTTATLSYQNQVLTVTFSVLDSAAIKLTPGLAKTSNSSFFSCTFNTIQDIAGNKMQPISTANARKFDAYVRDNISPECVSFLIDMNNGILTLNFDEPVIASSVNVTLLTLQSAFYRYKGTYHTLSSKSKVVSSDGIVVIIQMSDGDVHQIKNSDNLARAAATSFITLTSGFVADTSANSVKPIVDGEALLCSKFTKDSTSPILTFVSFNKDSGLITMNFNELVLPASVNGDGLTVKVSEGPSHGYSYTLSSYSSAINTDQFSLSIQLLVYVPDMNAIKNLNPLASSLDTTYIALSGIFITDTYGNPVEQIYPWESRRVDEWFPDVTPPKLVSYELNLDQNFIGLTFDESVDGSNLNLSQVIIQTLPIRAYGSSISFEGATYFVGGGYDANQLSIILQGAIINYMKLNRIGNTAGKSLLTWSGTFIQDFSGNHLLPVYDGSIVGGHPVPPNTFEPDRTSPSVVFWFVDYSTYQINIRFDEPVVIKNITNFVLWEDKPIRGLNSYEFDTVTSISVSPDDPDEFIVTIRDKCFNASLPLSLCGDYSLFHMFKTTKSKLYLTCTPLGAEDLALDPNMLLNIPLGNPLVAGEPDCSNCGPGFYISKMCTSKSDRVCSPCTVCGSGLWAKEQCSTYQDTGCTACSFCPFGTYISRACGNAFDTTCSPCDVCSPYEYIATECKNGVNTVCNSCEKCDFTDNRAKQLCQGGYYTWWALSNCCRDKNGKSISCHGAGLENVILDTIGGHHHWEFETSNPKVPTGFEFGKYF